MTAVEASAHSTAWVLERASDGASAVVEFSAGTIAASVVAAGTVVSVTALAAGWLLSAAGEALCLIPNALGESLLYDEDHAMKAALLLAALLMVAPLGRAGQDCEARKPGAGSCAKA